MGLHVTVYIGYGVIVNLHKSALSGALATGERIESRSDSFNSREFDLKDHITTSALIVQTHGDGDNDFGQVFIGYKIDEAIDTKAGYDTVGLYDLSPSKCQQMTTDAKKYDTEILRVIALLFGSSSQPEGLNLSHEVTQPEGLNLSHFVTQATPHLILISDIE